jgi:hypothetical protein
MADKKNQTDHLERIMNHLADSVFDPSDEAILAEITEAGADPHEAARRMRNLLRQSSNALEGVNQRLESLGHIVDTKRWQAGERGYHNNCRLCELSVNFSAIGNEMWGDALVELCPERDTYTVPKREASGG